MNYYRLDKVIRHLGQFSRDNSFYGKLLRQYELLGYLTERQVSCVERNIDRDIEKARRDGLRAIRAWNNQ